MMFMNKGCQLIVLKALTVLVVGFVLAFGPGSGPVYAQTLGQYFLAAFPVSLGGLERYIGPLVPIEGIGSTFRSETGFALHAALPVSAILHGDGIGELNLKDTMVLDKNPLRHDFYGHIRLWRIGLRAVYSNFDAQNLSRNAGQLDFTGLILGGDFDFVCHNWFQAGLGADYYFNEPRLNTNIVSVPTSLQNTLGTSFVIDLKGKPSLAVGPYIRYIPPEILGFPVHVESFLKLPLQGSRKTSYGAALVFRPQIYRFDLGARFSYERTWYKFKGDYTINGRDISWKLDTEWDIYGIQALIYF